jgi:hypothetical protein
MEQFLLEALTLKSAEPVDMNTAAITGHRTKLAKGDRLAIIVNMGDSTAAVADFSLVQSNAASAGTSKALSVDNPYFKKVGAATSFTKVEPTAAASNYVLSTDFAADPGMVVFEVLGEDLDVNNGFAWVSLDIADSTAAKLVSVVHVLHAVREKPAYSIVV